jgi:hypothetical protein
MEKTSSVKAVRTARFKELAKIEPRLLALEQDAKDFHESRGRGKGQWNDRWYGARMWEGRGLRNQMIYLVGTLATDPRLKSSEVYDICYHHLCGLL